MPVPWIPFSISCTKISAISSSLAVHEHLRQMVVGVDAGRRDHVEAASSRDAFAEGGARWRNSALGSTTVSRRGP